MVVEHGEPLWFHDFEESFSEMSGFLSDLSVAFVVCVGHDKLQFVLSELIYVYSVTKTYLLAGLSGLSRLTYFLTPLGRKSKIVKVW